MQLIRIPVLVIVVLVFCSLVTHSPLIAQQDLEYLLDSAEQKLDTGERDSAFFYAQRLDSLLVSRGDAQSALFARSQVFQGEAYCSRFQYENAIGPLYEAIEILEKKKTHRHTLARAYLAAGACNDNLNTRIAMLDKAFAIFTVEHDSLNASKTCLDLAIAYYRKGNLEQSREYCQAGLKLMANIKAEERIRLRLEFALGRYYAGIGNDEAAIYYMRKAFDRLLRTSPKDPIVFVISDELGKLYYANGDYDKGIAVFLKPIDDYEGEKSRHRLYAESGNWFSLGEGYLKAGETTKAEKAFLTSIQCIEPYYGEDNVFVSYPHTLLARMHQELGNDVKAQTAIDEFVRLITINTVQEHPDYGYLTLNAAQVLAREGRLTEALAFIDNGMLGLRYPVDSLPDFENVYRYDLLADLLNEKTAILEELSLQDEQYTEAYERQVRHHVIFLDSLQVQRLDPSSRIAILESHYHVYDKAVNIARKDYELSGSEDDLLRGLEYSEKSKDQLLAQFLIRNKLKVEQRLPDEVLREEQRLNSELSKIEIALYMTPENDEVAINDLQRRKIETQLSLDNLYLEINNPGLIQQYRQQAANIADRVVRAQNEGSVIIEIFQGKDYDHFFVIDEGLHWYTLSNRNKDTLISALTNYADNEAWVAASAAVREYLKPVLEHIGPKTPDVAIIPDGDWALIPFDILQGSNGQLLLENHSIHYHNSLKHRNLDVQPAGRSSKGFAAFAPEYTELRVTPDDTAGHAVFAELVRSGEYQLPGALAEAESVSEIMHGNLFTKTQASKDNFRLEAPQYRVLHLSMHAILEPGDPRYSRLVFTPSGGNGDNYLFSTELSKLNLSADLAVLSACNTGTGKSIKGEGVMSLARAFQYAGVPGTVHSLWKVPDASTSRIMISFYEFLRAGKDVAEALRLAKLEYIEQCKTPELAHPYYWAGFVAHGKTDPVDLSGPMPISRYILLGSVALAVILIFAWRSKKGRAV